MRHDVHDVAGSMLRGSSAVKINRSLFSERHVIGARCGLLHRRERRQGDRLVLQTRPVREHLAPLDPDPNPRS
jgi:hypothetical protein